MMMRSDQSPSPQDDDDDSNVNMSSYDTPPDITTSSVMSISPPDIMRIAVVEDGTKSHVLIPQRNSSTLKVDINDLPSLPFLDGPTMDHSQASSKSMNDITPLRRSVTQETKPSLQDEWKQPMTTLFQSRRQSGARCA